MYGIQGTSGRGKVLLVFANLALLANLYIYGHGLTNGPPIRSDGVGYHAYLPALFIDHDLTFWTMANRLYGGAIPEWTGIILYPANGNYLDKFPIGTALLQAPFFLVADFIAALFGLERSGVSSAYQIANMASGIFYFVMGVFFVFKTLEQYFETRTILLTVCLVVFGTNVFHYATCDSFASHIYSFALVSVYVWLMLRYAESPGGLIAAASGAVLGLIIITRNQDAILGLIALGVLVQSVRRFGARLLAIRDGTVFFLGLLGTVVPLFAYWYFATGHLIVYSYQTEPFNWAQPNILNFLFSVQKGLLFWSPSLLIALVGFLFLPIRLRVFGICAFICVIIHVYICASWYQWWFGGSFGSRPFVEMMPILAVPTAAAMSRIVTYGNAIIARGIAIALIAVNAILMHSYWLGIIPISGTTIQDLQNLPIKYYTILISGGLH